MVVRIGSLIGIMEHKAETTILCRDYEGVVILEQWKRKWNILVIHRLRPELCCCFCQFHVLMESRSICHSVRNSGAY